MKMGKKVREYKSGDFIFAKVKGYPAWPARVQRQNGKKYFVYFYGTGETANLPPNMIFDYSENKDKFLNKSVKRKDFNDGVKQIEHDFANNVPLEQVVGALAEAEPAPADDTANDTADDIADDSGAADTTADDTMEEPANAANDGPVEDSDDAGALVIDEGKQKGRKSSAKPPATPAAGKEPRTPRGRARRDDVTAAVAGRARRDDVTATAVAAAATPATPGDEEVVSRSGRKIRPKRYMDEETEETGTPAPASKKRRASAAERPHDRNIKAYNTVQQSELRELKEPFKSADADKENILITYLPSGQICGVRLFQARPASFRSEASRLQWDKQAASNAITLKRQLEKGQITPQSISAQLVMDLNLTEDEKKALDKDRDLEMKKSRLHFLKTEMKLIELDAKIKTCLSLEKADTDLCLKLIDEILELDLAGLMLLKHPTCMETVKRMRVYVGNAPSWEMSDSEALTFSKQAHRIRNKADALFITMRDLFEVPEGASFWEYFNERVALFKALTDKLHADKLLEMVHEPIELSQPSVHSMKAAVDAANDTEAGAEDADQKKKATPAKGKKANSTPLKQPLKRQSSRKQQQEEKEKEKEKEPEKPAEDIPEEPDTNKPNDADKADSSEASTENDKTTENEKTNEPEKPNENETDEADREVEKVNENSDKNEKEPETDHDQAAGDGEKLKEDSAKEKKSNSKGKGDKIENETNDNKDKTDDKDSEDKDKSSKDSKKKETDKTSSDKNSKDNGKSKSKDDKDKSKDDKANDKKDDAKNGKEKARAGEKRKDKGSDKEKSEEKEKVEVDEPRAKRSRESKKTEPPPRSPTKRKSRS